MDDVARAFDAILHKGELGMVYNVGTTHERSVKEVAMAICKHMRLDPAQVLEYVEDRAFNDQRYYLETSKLAQIGWTEKVPALPSVV